MTHEELLAHATERCERGCADVGAAFDCDRTEADRDRARRWRFLIVDRKGGAEYVEFVAPQIASGDPLLVEPLEEAVEHFVSRHYPAEVRLEELKLESESSKEPVALPLQARYRREPAASV